MFNNTKRIRLNLTFRFSIGISKNEKNDKLLKSKLAVKRSGLNK